MNNTDHFIANEQVSEEPNLKSQSVLGKYHACLPEHSLRMLNRRRVFGKLSGTSFDVHEIERWLLRDAPPHER